MKSYIHIFKYIRVLIIIGLLSLSGCEDVVQIDTPAEPPRLIIDAIIKVDETIPVMVASVKVTETNSFFGEIPVTGLKQITLNDLQGGYAVLKERIPGSGIYEQSLSLDFLKSEEIILQVTHKDQLYLARTQYVPTVPIDNIVQGSETFFGEDDTELILTFTDNAERDDFYLFDFDFDNLLTTEDEFYQGQAFSFSYFYEDGLEAGQNVEISIIGVDQQFYAYMNQLIDQSGIQDFGPFDTPAATVRGNIINVTEIDNIDFFDNVDQTDNFALGYFAIVQINTRSITIE